MKITILTLTKKKIIVEDIWPNNTIEHLKKLITATDGIPHTQQILHSDVDKDSDEYATVFKDFKTLEDYNIEDGSIIHLKLNLRGD